MILVAATSTGILIARHPWRKTLVINHGFKVIELCATLNSHYA